MKNILYWGGIALLLYVLTSVLPIWVLFFVILFIIAYKRGGK